MRIMKALNKPLKKLSQTLKAPDILEKQEMQWYFRLKIKWEVWLEHSECSR